MFKKNKPFRSLSCRFSVRIALRGICFILIVAFQAYLQKSFAQTDSRDATPLGGLSDIPVEEIGTNHQISSAITSQMNVASFDLVPDSVELKALIELYDSTGGSGWTNQANWLQGTTSADFNTWHGITVVNGDISRIDLRNNGLTGSLPSTLGDLKGLNFISFHTNNLTGPIPHSIGNLFNLRDLYLDSNNLNGSIPSSLGNLDNLRVLALGGNDLSGPIPSSLGNLSNLVTWSTGGNNLNGPIPASLGNLTNLQRLHLNNNNLSGSIPKELGNLSNLWLLNLDYNNLSGPIPPELSNLNNLTYFHLRNNNLSGSIPPSLGNLTKLTELMLWYNQLSGEIPPELGNLINIQNLGLTYNNLSGQIPPELGDLTNIIELTMFGNNLTGQIPASLGNLVNLRTLDLQNNNLNGDFPLALGNLFDLHGLGITNNNITGRLPASMANFPNLRILLLGNNSLTWIPDFSQNPNRANLEINVLFNRLDFGSIEPNMTDLGQPAIKSFSYNFQDRIGEALSLEVPVGTPLELQIETGGAHNLYQWRKFDPNLHIIPEANSAVYLKPKATFSDAGEYQVVVSNSLVTDLTLYSHAISVIITEAVPDPPTADSVHLCLGETAILTASGEGTIYWFSAESGGDTLAIGSSYTTPVLSESATYYVSQQVGDLHSERVPVVALVGPVFTAPEDQSICMGSDVTLAIMGENFAIDWGNLGNDLAIVVSPDTTTTYVYTVEDEFGCAVTDSITVTVLDSLIAEIIPPAAVCPGDLVTFEAVEVPGATYTWEPGELSGRTITVQADEMQEYTVTLTNSNGCTATASEFVPFAALATVSENQTICVTDSVVLNVEGGDSYLWSTGDTTAQITFHPEAAGEYTFTVNVTTDSCTSSQDVVVTVEPYCPGVPVSFYARAISTSEITLQWQEPEGNHEQYVIQKRNAEGLYETVATVPIGNASWDDTALEPDSLYYYRIFSQVVSAQSTDRFGRARTFKPNENYVREMLVLVDGVKDASLVPSLPHNERSSSWTYLNGLGSEMQTIMEAASPSGKDIVQPILYDENGMVTMQYLPYTINQPEPGNFRREAKQETLDFYANPPAAVATSLFPYAETVYGKSPQNNVIGQGAPGEAWQVGMGHSVTLASATNSATDVLLWEYNAGIGALVANAYYPEAQLMKAITINEDGEKSAVYTDMLGRKLKQEVHLTNEDIIATYFVYNNRGSLLFEITPLVIDQFTSDESFPYTINQNIIQNLCYTYSYDEQERLVETRWADKEVIYYVYDRWDRLVLSQDGNQRQKNEWSFIKYDRYNRSIMSGLYETSNPYSRIEMQAEVDSYYAQPTASRFESFGGEIHRYTNLSFPVLGEEKAYLTITYYDDYAFMDEANGFGAAYVFDETALSCETVIQNTYCFPSGESPNTLGKVTGSKTKVIGRDQWLNAVMYYDERGRNIQSVTGNYVGSVDRQSSLFNFSGWLLATHLSHHGADDMSRGIKRRYVYDHTGRLLEGYHELFDNGISQGEVFLAENKYNELGQLIEKNLHIEHGAPIQSIDYRYNIRGWLQSINGANPEAGQGINDNDARQDLFGMELIYDGVLNGAQNGE